MRLGWLVNLTLVILSVSAQAEEGAPALSCRSFLDRALKFNYLSIDSAQRGSPGDKKTWEVTGGGDTSDAPFISLTPTGEEAKKRPRYFTSTEDNGGWKLEFVKAPMKHYIYHFKIRNHACELKTLQIETSNRQYSQKKCEEVLKAAKTPAPHLREACDIANGYFVADHAPTMGAGHSAPSAGSARGGR
jgi:hypothetical protein